MQRSKSPHPSMHNVHSTPPGRAISPIPRNVSMRHAQGEWIFLIDADEELENAARHTMQKLVRNKKLLGYSVLIEMHPDFTPMRSLRLFRNMPSLRLEGVFHEESTVTVLWPGSDVLLAVTEYLKETGDFGLLDAKEPFLDGGEGTVLDHLLAVAASPGRTRAHTACRSSAAAIGTTPSITSAAGTAARASGAPCSMSPCSTGSSSCWRS